MRTFVRVDQRVKGLGCRAWFLLARPHRAVLLRVVRDLGTSLAVGREGWVASATCEASAAPFREARAHRSHVRGWLFPGDDRGRARDVQGDGRVSRSQIDRKS